VDDEPEQEDAQDVVASEKDEPDTGVQTRRGPSPSVAIVTPTRIPISARISQVNVRPMPRRIPRGRKRSREKSPNPSRKANLSQARMFPFIYTLSNPLVFLSADQEAAWNHFGSSL
jgi:hypothetical protein